MTCCTANVCYTPKKKAGYTQRQTERMLTKELKTKLGNPPSLTNAVNMFERDLLQDALLDEANGQPTSLGKFVRVCGRCCHLLKKANDPRKCLTHLRGSAEFSRAPGGAQQESVFASRPYGQVRSPRYLRILIA
jgi:hypothetical protein